MAFVYGVGAAFLGALLTCIPVFVAWAMDPKSSTPGNDAFGVALDLWALAHRAHVTVAGTHVVATPLVLTFGYGLLARGAALRAFPNERLATRDLQLILWGFLGGYLVGAQLIGVLSSIGPARTSWWTLILGPAAVALVAAGTVYLTMRGHSPEVARLDARVRDMAPLVMQRALGPAMRALRWWLLSGFVLTFLLAVWHGSRVLTITQQLDAGVLGNIMLVLAQLLFIVNASVFGGAWLSGGDVMIGSATFGHGSLTTGTLPIVPIFGALPDTPGGSWTWASVLVPLALGAWLGVAAARTTSKLSSLRIKVVVAAAASVIVTLAAGLLMWLSTVSVSTGLLAHAGPSAISLLWLALELVSMSTLAAAVWHWRANHQAHRLR